MLLFDSPTCLNLSQLEQVYRQSIQGDEGVDFDHNRFGQDLQDFEQYWRHEFFSVAGATCAVLEQNGNYISVLRLEPYRNGLLITGLETAPEHRNKGMATTLLRDVIQHFRTSGGVRLYSHIHRRNKPSVCVHKSCGFYLLTDHAVFLDGSVSQKYDTYALDI